MINSFDNALRRHQQTFEKVKELGPDALRLAEAVIHCLKSGGKVLWMGNGGSAADSQHLAAEFMVRYKAERRPLPSIALTTDSSILTAHTNDYEFDTLFARQVEGLARKEDLVIGISTSGNSNNIIKAIEQAKAMGVTTATLLGRDGGKLKDLADHSIIIPGNETARIQEAHLFIGHWLCEEIDYQLADSNE
ncbi:SIS domain-containing protein [Motiliproteus sp. MSK22-1]|uniref:D-sedoheptulose-7-phosphate isomerase n=1 Tax=Motiliproteus sp. MSK22-1 TaxID=1897630 RepID=UPI001E28C7DF|nr:D-sedoheptulose 7-phosphate isomerase [Motiliproteus sp. MSK22-1]